MAERMVVFDEQFDSLERAMSIAAQRQAVIAHNIANAKTPGYEALDFDAELLKATARQGNMNVILEDEMAKLANNSVEYSAFVKLLSSKINILRTIATQGKR